MIKRLIAPLILAAGILGVVGGVSYAAAGSHGSTSTNTTVTSTPTAARTTPTAATSTSCPHDSATTSTPGA